MFKTHVVKNRLSTLVISATIFVFFGAAATGWLCLRVLEARESLTSVQQLAPRLKDEILSHDTQAVKSTLNELRRDAAKARESTGDPLWSLAIALPWIGPNFGAVREAARSADDVIQLGASPLIEAYAALDWKGLIAPEDGVDLTPLEEASPKISAAAQAVRQSSDRLNNIPTAELFPEVSAPLIGARDQLESMRSGLDAAADAVSIAPAMMGAEKPRHYLLMVQNNAELRATGGIPGALAVLSIHEGQVSLTGQSSAAAMGEFSPPMDVEPEQRQIYSSRIGRFMQDVTLTPDFPTAAKMAREMWVERMGHPVDGVISMDPVALRYVLDATGPVQIMSPELAALSGTGLPEQLNAQNVIQTLLSDVYTQIRDPELQDAYFAVVAQEVFAAMSDGDGDAKALFDGLTRATTEGRIRIWSGDAREQSVIKDYPVSGSISGDLVGPAQFGVYFNDGTGAKMDYFIKRTVQLVRECPKDGYKQTTIRVTTTNTAPLDAAISLPAYVTGDGAFGVPAGSVQTNIVVYGPVQASVETATIDGDITAFAPHVHGNRPVGVLAVRVAPGESHTVEMTFGKIVQHSEPTVAATPTVQEVHDVVLPATTVNCGVAS